MSGRAADAGPTLADLAADPARAMGLPSAEAIALLAQAEGLAAVLRVRLAGTNGPSDVAESRPEPREDRLLTAAEVASCFGRSVGWVYRNARRWPFTVREGRKTVRFSEAGFERYVSSRTAGRR